MKWTKKGLIYGPKGEMPWAQHSALTPTPVLLSEDTIRVYAGFRDSNGVSRIGYVDVVADDPSCIVSVSKKPVLDIGEPGMFDDNGILPGDIIRVGDKFYLYYLGFQLAQKVKFLMFSGLAVSDDNGRSFSRLSKTPIMDRSAEGPYIRAITSVIEREEGFRAWYPVGERWEYINGEPYPSYYIKSVVSHDGIHFPAEGASCITQSDGREYRLARPKVYKLGDKYIMLYTRGILGGAFYDYLPGYAESEDGLNWTRKDAEVGLMPSGDGWDSQWLTYPSLLWYKDRVYAFYNGNEMGKEGFGYAVLEGRI